MGILKSSLAIWSYKRVIRRRSHADAEAIRAKLS
jgi:hypothetical protein